MTMSKNIDINAIGLRCPEPLMIVRKAMRHLDKGDTVTVIADDPSTERDFELLCVHMEYKMLKKELNDNILSFVMQK
ncbi:MAG: sulfurtransferase TusA [Ruminobacter sp.]|nr:sulfurtransferase TusA [Ruminobacter sp.]MBR1924366.1 sulfurtransferase TusA [Ruminobacter sp.]